MYYVQDKCAKLHILVLLPCGPGIGGARKVSELDHTEYREDCNEIDQITNGSYYTGK